jgi:hypothetical protein
MSATNSCFVPNCKGRVTNFVTTLGNGSRFIYYGPKPVHTPVCKGHFLATCGDMLDREVDLPDAMLTQYLAIPLPNQVRDKDPITDLQDKIEALTIMVGVLTRAKAKANGGQR